MRTGLKEYSITVIFTLTMGSSHLIYTLLIISSKAATNGDLIISPTRSIEYTSLDTDPESSLGIYTVNTDSATLGVSASLSTASSPSSHFSGTDASAGLEPSLRQSDSGIFAEQSNYASPALQGLTTAVEASSKVDSSEPTRIYSRYVESIMMPISPTELGDHSKTSILEEITELLNVFSDGYTPVIQELPSASSTHETTVKAEPLMESTIQQPQHSQILYSAVISSQDVILNPALNSSHETVLTTVDIIEEEISTEKPTLVTVLDTFTYTHTISELISSDVVKYSGASLSTSLTIRITSLQEATVYLNDVSSISVKVIKSTYLDLSTPSLCSTAAYSSEYVDATLNPSEYVGATLNPSEYVGATLNPSEHVGATMNPSDFVVATLVQSDYVVTSVNPTGYIGASLNPFHFDDASLNPSENLGASLNPSELVGAPLYLSELVGASLYHSELVGASLSPTELIGASLYPSELVGVSLHFSEYIGASTSPPVTETITSTSSQPTQVTEDRNMKAIDTDSATLNIQFSIKYKLNFLQDYLDSKSLAYISMKERFTRQLTALYHSVTHFKRIDIQGFRPYQTNESIAVEFNLELQAFDQDENIISETRLKEDLKDVKNNLQNQPDIDVEYLKEKYDDFVDKGVSLAESAAQDLCLFQHVCSEPQYVCASDVRKCVLKCRLYSYNGPSNGVCKCLQGSKSGMIVSSDVECWEGVHHGHGKMRSTEIIALSVSLILAVIIMMAIFTACIHYIGQKKHKKIRGELTLKTEESQVGIQTKEILDHVYIDDEVEGDFQTTEFRQILEPDIEPTRGEEVHQHADPSHEMNYVMDETDFGPMIYDEDYDDEELPCDNAGLDWRDVALNMIPLRLPKIPMMDEGSE